MADVKHWPWTADIGETAVVRDKHGNQVAIFTHLYTRSGGRRGADEVAHACRIAAAAPDLLEALQAVLPHLLAGEALVSRAAIAKATGAARAKEDSAEHERQEASFYDQ
jgi:hypothetical protein